MAKYYAFEQDGVVKLSGVRDGENVPEGAVEITTENYKYIRKNIRTPIDRKIVGNEVVERTPEEKEAARTGKYFDREQRIARYKLGRRSYRLVRHPFAFDGNMIKLEEGDLSGTPYSIFSTWDNYIRDAVMCELSGNSVLPIKVLAENDSEIVVDSSKKLYELHASMVLANKKTLEEESALRQELRGKDSYSGVMEVRAANRERVK